MAIGLAFSHDAIGQRTDDNATAEADDAFGRSVGDERIGVYYPGDVRGFSPIDAGNVRLEGLYFGQQKDPNSRLIEGSAIRVGIAAQSYPFPSPTGIVDYELRRAGEEQVISTVLSVGPFDGAGGEIDAQIPVRRGRFGIAFGAGIYRKAFEWGATNHSASVALIPVWRPTDNLELQPFFSRLSFRDEEPRPLMITADGELPPQIRRNRYYGQSWTQARGEILNYGLLGKARLGPWTARLGVFESVYSPQAEFADLFADIQESGAANETVVASPEARLSSKSGELRMTRSAEQGNRRHTVHLAARARLQRRRFGGEDLIGVGPVQLGVGREIAEPAYIFGAQSRDEVTQETLGAAYGLQLKRGEMSLGVQKTSYSKATQTPTGALPDSRAEPALWNMTATVHATNRLALYGSYTEGLEESPVAPSNAVNRNVAAPALLTEQYDAGIRLILPADLKLITGVFSIEKPYFDLDAAGFFRQLGTVQHRGIEVSLSGTPLRNLTAILGARFLDASVSGPIVDAGLMGAKPVGKADSYSSANLDYVFPGTGFSFDATLDRISKQVANTSNTAFVPGRTILHAGSRYRFKLFSKPATLRAQLNNVFDKYGWTAVSSGTYVYNQPRRLTVSLAADF